MLGPRQVVTLTIHPPLAEHEQPVLITPQAGDVLIQEAGLDFVTVANQADRISAFGVTVLPRMVVRAATLPWGQIARDLGDAVKASGVVDQFKQLLGRSR